jgi:hypothetical protein
MTEKPIPESSGDEQGEQRPLFSISRGHYGDVINYDIPTEAPAPFVTPEKPKKLEDMTADEMLEVAASDRLSPDIYGHFSDKRADFIREHSWTPYSEGEATRAIGGGLINYLLGARDKGGLAAVRDVLGDVDRDRAAAVTAVSDLRLVQDVESGEFNPAAARDNTYVRQALARAVLARNSLNLFEWPPHYDRRHKETRENRKTAAILLALTDRLASLDDETMKHLLLKTMVHQQERVAFWTDQMDKAGENERTRELVAAAKSRV